MLLSLFTGCSSVDFEDDFPELSQTNALAPPSIEFPLEFEGKDAKSLEIQLDRELEKNSDTETYWWVTYQKGRLWSQSNPEKACQNFTQLAQAQEFPLKTLALIRANQICQDLPKNLVEIYPTNKFNMTPWLTELAVEVGLSRARKQGQWWHQMHLAVEKSKHLTIQSEKIALMQEALSIAQIHGDPRYLQDFKERLYKIAPRLRPHPQYNHYFSIAYDFRRIRNFQKARWYYRKIISSTKDSHAIYRALKGIQTCYKLERNMPEYLRATDSAAQYATEIFKQKQDYHLHHNAQIMKARAHWTEGNSKKAKKILALLTKDLKNNHSLGQIYWLRSRIEEESKKYKAALFWLKKAQTEKNSSPLSEEILWFQAWNYRKLKDYPKSIALLKELVKTSKSHKSQYGFWLAKTLQLTGNQTEAFVELQTVLHEDPIGYYGLLAHRELDLDFTSMSDQEQYGDLNFSTSVVSSWEDNYLKWVLAIGEKQIAGEVLTHLARRFKNNKSVADNDRKLLMRRFAESGNYLGLYTQLANLDAHQRKSFYYSNPSLIFPRPYQNHVTSASNQFGVHPELIYAIMRQESAFNPRARSSADAFGLLQLIPKVAKKSAPRAQVKFQETSDLYNPQKNITLGSAYIRELWDRYNGQFILTVASYNASEKAIENWIHSRFNGDPLEFIEDIPYKETQGYVKRVLRNLIFYRKGTAGDKSIPFPEWCLENIQDFKS